jgi:catechol 2,3-dioxygenase-like lactoylglutathione lyase family enzyme
LELGKSGHKVGPLLAQAFFTLTRIQCRQGTQPARHDCFGPPKAWRYDRPKRVQRGAHGPAGKHLARWRDLMLGTIAHIALTVRDPTRTAHFLKELFDAPIVRRTDADGHDETFIRLGVTWFALVGAQVERERTGDHVALRIARESIASIVAKLEAKGCEFILAKSGTSLYFFDFDNHVFELDSSDEELELDRLAHAEGK